MGRPSGRLKPGNCNNRKRKPGLNLRSGVAKSFHLGYIHCMKTQNPFIAQRLQEKLDRIRNSHSAFWMGDAAEELLEKVEVGSIEYIERLRKVQRATGNFVKIVTGREIPVVYSSGQHSYTDGKSVVLSADIDPSKLDAMVGVALHEGTHCLLSNESLAFLPEMHKRFVDMVQGRDILRHAQRLGIPLTSAQVTPTFGKHGDTVLDHVQMVMNVLEDRRIDLWMYQNAAGYRPYYEAMYNEYWHSPKIDKAMRDPRFRESAVHNYIMFVINLTNDNFDAQALPGLAEIRKIADLSTKGLEARGDDDRGWKSWRHGMNAMGGADLARFPKLFADSVRIVEIMYEHSTKVESSAKPDKGDMQPGEGGGEGEGEGLGGDLPNMDGGGRPVTLEEIREAIAKQRKFLNHDTGKQQIDATTQQQLDQMDQTKANVVEVEGEFLPRGVKAKVIIYRDVTKDTVKSAAFPFKFSGYYRSGGDRNPGMEQALRDGRRMGAVLAHRIRVMQDERPLVFNRQEHGKLDKRRVAQLGAGMMDVFAFTVIEKKKPANVWLDVDFSGSMSGEKSQQAMMLAVAIAYAAEKTRTLNVTIAVRDGGNDCARVAILYDSRRTQFARFADLLPYIGAVGGTPESLAFEAIKDEMMKMYKDERKFFINLSDGEPGHGFSYKGKHYSYGGEGAYKHTRMLMNDFRNAGIKVMSYYIGHGGYEHAAFRKMYGQDARFIDPSSVGQLVATVNKLLMQDDK